MEYKEIIRTIDSVKMAIVKNFRKCMDMGEFYESVQWRVDMSQVYSPCDKEGSRCRVEDADHLGKIVIRISKGANLFPLHGLWQFLCLVEPPKQIPSNEDEFVFETMMIDNDGSVSICLDAERMFKKFGDTNENP